MIELTPYKNTIKLINQGGKNMTQFNYKSIQTPSSSSLNPGGSKSGKTTGL